MSAHVAPPSERPYPVRRLTRLLADMQTTIVAGGLRTLAGELDRFVIFSLIVRESFGKPDRTAPISTYSLALSLGRPFETVRRHVNALIADGRCVRIKGGVTVAPDAWAAGEAQQLLTLVHDAFVRFVEDSAGQLGDTPRPARRPYDAAVGIQAAADLMLATIDSNRDTHAGWIDLVLFSTVLHANLLRYEADPGEAPALTADHAVRGSAIARALNLPETTVRRRLAAMSAAGGAVVQTRRGFLVSTDWLDAPQALATSLRTYSSIRRILARAAARGFPVDAPASAYLAGRPPSWTLA